MSLEGKFIIPLKDLEEHLVDYEYHLDEEFFKVLTKKKSSLETLMPMFQ